MEFIPYEQSLQLKELGFDKPCVVYCWDKNYKHPEYLEISTTPHWAPLNIQNHNSYSTRVSRPTYSQAFEWFREKHMLYHDIKMFGDWDKPQFSYIVSGRTMDHPSHMWHYKTADLYTEAELECLKKLIELISTLKP